MVRLFTMDTDTATVSTRLEMFHGALYYCYDMNCAIFESVKYE